jgi:hypothetical protein
MPGFAEVAVAKPHQRRPVEGRVAADPIVGVRNKGLAAAVVPFLLGAVLLVEEDRFRVPVLGLARDVLAAFEDEDLLAGRREPLRQRAAAGARSDDDDVEMRVAHAQASSWR